MGESPSISRISRLRAHAHYYAQGLYTEIAAKNLFLWAQAIAFKVLVTIVPIVILATGLVGRVLRGSDAFAAVARFIHDFLPPSQSHQVVNFLHQLQSSSGAIVGIGGVGLFLSAVSLFITLRVAVSNAFEQDWHKGRSLLGGYLFDVRMVLQVGLLFIVTIGMSVFVQSINGPDMLPFAGLDQPWVRESWQQTIRSLGLFVPFFITTAMFFQLYYLVPKPHPRKRSAISGALIAGILWEITKQIFTYYATYVGQFDRYTSEGLGALGNTFALIIAFVFWVYFSGVVLMIGAVVASLREHRHVTSGLLPGQKKADESPDQAGETGEAGPADPPDETGDTGNVERTTENTAELSPHSRAEEPAHSAGTTQSAGTNFGTLPVSSEAPHRSSPAPGQTHHASGRPDPPSSPDASGDEANGAAPDPDSDADSDPGSSSDPKPHTGDGASGSESHRPG